MKKKILCCLLTAFAMTGFFSITAFARVDGYVVKANNNLYKYDMSVLIDSFLKSEGNEHDILYKDFLSRVKSGQIYMLHDDSGKYVSYEEITQKFLEYEGDKLFNLNEVIKELNKKEISESIYNVNLENNEIIEKLIKQKQNNEIKEENNTSSSSGSSEKEKSGNKNDEKNEDDDKDKDSENKKVSKETIARLEKIKSKLPKVEEYLDLESQKTIIRKIDNCIGKILKDANYDYSNEVEEVKKLYNNLGKYEKQDLQTAVIKYIGLEEIQDLIKIFGIDIRDMIPII
ncbi:hypothetical protein OW763_08375 [Clostridium aestuarii]|uniref:DUF1002 domain-containing protein n=1 Tax=Clostridium aestuarii TaxID=338193 RepID=A0ABT4CZF8_9CLOT|nr:hypothetical protein [Clostridium aestuarii]MCY6484371.1 hypothetical protein [Clostridium aestuarii]